MDDYVKRIKLLLEPKIEDKSEKEVENKFKKFTDNFAKAFNKVFEGDSSKSAGNILGNKLATSLGKVLTDSWELLKKTLKDSWEELGNMLDYSLLSNQRTRELAFTYGFSGSQAYGYDKAMALMGFGSEEDYMYATGEQKKQFAELFTKYTNKYSELYDSGFFEEYRNFQVEMADFKQEVQMKFIKFFMDHKDTIMGAMEAILKLTEGVLSILDFLVRVFGGGRSSSQRISETNDIINSYGGNTNTSNNTNIKIDNTFNNVDRESQTWLANAGEMTYEQIIQALT